MADKYIAWRYFNDRRPAYVGEINNTGKGDRYGYVSDENKALPISSAEWKRFAKYMRDVGSVGFSAPFVDAARKSNPVRKPAAKKPAAKRAYVNRPSQATKKPPTRRLKARRAANVRGSGMFPNPMPHRVYRVYNVNADGTRGAMIAGFPSKSAAKEYAHAWSKKTGLPCFYDGAKAGRGTIK